MDLKKEAARHAINFIEPGQLVGLGAGATIAFMVQLLAEQKKERPAIQFLTSSFHTEQLLLQYGFTVAAQANFSEIDVYFDGCDQLDTNLNALKSGAGIHTQEKLLASMARQFIIVGDYTKYVQEFTTGIPLVVEMLPEASGYVPACLQRLFPGVKTAVRMNDKRDGPVITKNGNYLVDSWFSTWPNLTGLNTSIKSISGVIETSLFYNLVHKAVIAGNESVQIIEK